MAAAEAFTIAGREPTRDSIPSDSSDDEREAKAPLEFYASPIAEPILPNEEKESKPVKLEPKDETVSCERCKAVCIKGTQFCMECGKDLSSTAIESHIKEQGIVRLVESLWEKVSLTWVQPSNFRGGRSQYTEVAYARYARRTWKRCAQRGVAGVRYPFLAVRYESDPRFRFRMNQQGYDLKKI